MLLFDLLRAEDDDEEGALLERFMLVVRSIPIVAAIRLICGGTIVCVTSIAGSPALFWLLATIAGIVFLDLGFWALAHRPSVRLYRPHILMRASAGYVLIAHAVWAALPALVQIPAEAEHGLLICAALVSSIAVAGIVLFPIPAAAVLICIAALGGAALWASDLGMFLLVSVAPFCLAWLSLLHARRGYSQLKRQAFQEWDAQRSNRLLAEFEESGKGWFWETNADGTLSYISEHLARALGRTASELIGTSLTQLMSAYDNDPDEEINTERSLGFHLSGQLPFSDLTVRANTKQEIWWSISGHAAHDPYGRFLGFRGICTDLTEIRRSKAELSRLARYDSLTGLANRATMRRTLEEALRSAVRRKGRCSLFLLDLDRFNIVNDTLGHPIGDTLLRLVALRMADVIGETGQIGRVGGDEFQAIFPKLDDEDELAKLAEQLIASISRPYQIGKATISIGASVGIAISAYKDGGADELIRDADLALYAAKAAGKGIYCFFAPEMHAEAQNRQVLENDLRWALTNDELKLAFQPVVNLKTEKVVGFETLLRWTHPTRGPISPAVFIPLAEEIGLINSIGEWVLRSACLEAAKWPADVSIAVNLSPIQFIEPNLPTLVLGALAVSQLPARRLELEITEGVLLNESPATDEMFARLQAIGVNLTLDDFGTGYASLSYLKKAPFSKIKIDQSFVRGAAMSGSRNAAIIRAIVSLATELGMETTAEGAETHDELALIKKLGCSLVQGYIYGKPIPAEDVLKLVSGNEDPRPNGFLRRRPDRYRQLRSAVLHWMEETLPVRLRNISAGGTLIESEVSLASGAKVQLDLAMGNPVSAEVVWCRGRDIGLKFDEEIDLQQFAQSIGGTKGARMLRPQYLKSGLRDTSG